MIEFPNLDKELEEGIKREVLSLLNKRMDSITNAIRNRLQDSLRRAITDSPEYQSIVSGILRAELGLPDTSVLDTIIDTWANGIQVKYKTNNSFGVINIGMIQSDYSDVLSLPEASFIYATRSGSNVIDWLRWLLLEGSSIIVVDYEFKASNKGRSGLGVMVKRDGGGWSIPSQFAGTSDDNFATRALQNIDQEIDDIVRQEITKGLK